MEKSKAQKQFDKRFGQYVKSSRLKKDWSQTELASRVDNNFQNISRIERGELSPTLFWCTKLAEALGMDLKAFLNEFKYKYRE